MSSSCGTAILSLFLYLNRDKKFSLGSKEVVVEELEWNKKWLSSHIGDDGWQAKTKKSKIKTQTILIEQNCWLSIHDEKSASTRINCYLVDFPNAMLDEKYGNQLVPDEGMNMPSRFTATLAVTCRRSISPSTLFFHYHANTFRIQAWSMETHKNLFWIKISIAANINPGKT